MCKRIYQRLLTTQPFTFQLFTVEQKVTQYITSVGVSAVDVSDISGNIIMGMR